MKKILALVIAIVMVLGCVPVLAEDEVEYKNIKIDVNDERIILIDAEDIQQKSIIANGQIYIPIECFINALGGKLSYDETENLLSITLANVGTASHVDNVPTEESAINNLGSLEREIFDALLIMLDDFYDPSSVRILEFRDYQNRSSYREGEDEIDEMLAGPDTIIVRLSAKNRVGGISAENYYCLCLSTWEEPKRDNIKTVVEIRRRWGESTLPYAGVVGDYYQLTEDEVSKISPWSGGIDSEKYVRDINAALKEHWNSLGIN